MTALLTFAAWLTALFFEILSAVMTGCFFLISPTFRRQAFARRVHHAGDRTVTEP
jgi:hypothetical protein